MSNHLFTRAGGVWASLSGLSAAEMADIDAKTVDSISATGGVYSLVSDLTIGGAVGVFFNVTAPFLVDNTFQVTEAFSAYSDAFFGGDFTELFTVEAITSLHGHFTEIGAVSSDILTVQAHADFLAVVNFDADAFFNQNVEFSGTSTFHGVVTIGDDGSDACTVNAFTQFNSLAVFNAGANYEGNAVFDGGALVRTPLTFSNTGRIVQRQVIGANADATYQAVAQSHVIAPATITAHHDYTIGDTGAVDGDRVRFTNLSSAFSISVKEPGGTVISTIDATSGAPHHGWCDAERVQGGWIAMWTGVNP